MDAPLAAVVLDKDALATWATLALGILLYALIVNGFYQVLSQRLLFVGRLHRETEEHAEEALQSHREAQAELKSARAEAEEVAREDPGASEARERAEDLALAREEAKEAHTEAGEALRRAARSQWRPWAAMGRYLVLFPLISFGYFLVLAGALVVLSAGQLAPEVVLILSMAIVGAVRVAAYLSESASHDLAKMLPLALLAVFLIEYDGQGTLESLAGLRALLDLWPLALTFYVLVVVLEVSLRIAYTAVHRVLRRRQSDRLGVG